MTPEQFYNEQQEDAERFKNFCYAILTVIGVIIGMIAVNILY